MVTLDVKKRFFVNYFINNLSKSNFIYHSVYNLRCFFIPLQFQVKMMSKKYFYITLLLICFFTLSGSAQETKQQSKLQESSVIEGLSLYPNPVSNGKVYISSKNDLDKEIIIFDVLGKKTLQTTISSRELNVSSLSSGVYIIKINEGEATATRKLIVK